MKCCDWPRKVPSWGRTLLRRSRPGRHRIGLALLIAGVAISALVCSDSTESDSAKSGPPSESSSQVDAEESANEVCGDHLPWSVSLGRMGVDEGGVWQGTVKSGRVILYLGAPAKRDDSFLAVLWESKKPSVRLFEVLDFTVDPEGGVAFKFSAVEGHSSWVSVLAYGDYADGKFRVDDVTFDRKGSLPTEFTLEKCSSIDDEVARLRARFKKQAEKPMSP